MAINPVIIVHGIQGSWLKDEYPVDYDKAVLWTGILKRNFGAIHLHPTDNTVDRDARRWIRPHQAVPLIYEGIVEEIREEMDDQPYAYVFTYDWRKDNRLAAQALATFVDRVLQVSGVHERDAGRPAPRQVVLVGHSMGGLVIKWCAIRILPYRKIAKIITIATPHRGSLKAVEALLPGARNLFGVELRKSMRHSARTLPGIYQLLPSWNRAVVTKAGEKCNIFKPECWQKSLVEEMKTRYGSDFFPGMLRNASAFSAVIRRPWPEPLRRKFYYAYGVGSDTWVQVSVDTDDDNFFDFKKAESNPLGDGTVHKDSSICREISSHRSRTHIDERYTIRDALIGQHANMPNHDKLQDWVLGILKVNPFADHSFESPR